MHKVKKPKIKFKHKTITVFLSRVSNKSKLNFIFLNLVRKIIIKVSAKYRIIK